MSVNVGVISQAYNRLGWKRLTDTKSVGDMDSGPACECSKEWGDFFHHFGTTLNEAKSVDEFKAQIIALIRQIWLASYAQRMSTCIISAVRDCLESRPKLPVNPSQFHNFQLEGKSLPAWIILHASSDDPSEVNTRHYLLQLFLDEFPLTESIRDELYLACAKRGFNNFFKRVRAKSLNQLQARPKTCPKHVEIGQGLRPPSGLTETLTIVPKSTGFKLKWCVPDMLQRLESGDVIGIEFVAKGQIWGMYIRSQGNQWEISVHPLEPSRIHLREESVRASLTISRHASQGKIFSRGSTGFNLNSNYGVSTVGLPVEGGMPAGCRTRSFPSRKGKKCLDCINKDGSCYLTLNLSSPAL